MIRGEALIMAGIGTALGPVLGTLFFWAMPTSAADGSDLDLVVSLPVAQLAVVVLMGIALGIAAAVVPAAQASRVEVLRAIAQE